MFRLNFCGLIERLFVHRGDIEGENAGKKNNFLAKLPNNFLKTPTLPAFLLNLLAAGKKSYNAGFLKTL